MTEIPTPRCDQEIVVFRGQDENGESISRELIPAELGRELERELAYMRTRNAEQATGQFGKEARAHADHTMTERARMQMRDEKQRFTVRENQAGEERNEPE